MSQYNWQQPVVQTSLFRGMTQLWNLSRMLQTVLADYMHGTPASSVKAVGLRPSLCTETGGSHSTLAQWKTQTLNRASDQSAASNSHHAFADTVMARRTQVYTFDHPSLPISFLKASVACAMKRRGCRSLSQRGNATHSTCDHSDMILETRKVLLCLAPYRRGQTC
jgi:hypothetical protein